MKKQKEVTDRTEEFWERKASEDLKTVMDAICHGYDEDSFMNKKDSIIFSTNIKFTKEHTILDLACGIGRTCKWVAPQVKSYIGIDFIPKMIEKARDYNKEYWNATFYTNDGKNLQMIENESIDIVYCELGFQHMLKDIQKSYVKEIHRVLKNNGLFYAQIPKLSFFKDESYALTEKECSDLLSDFQTDNLTIDPKIDMAYFTMRAKKSGGVS